MTPKEKAEDLVLKYSILKDGHNDLVKQCALLAVDEILNNNTKIPGTLGLHIEENSSYWQEVKQEIEKLSTND
jgi:hypothetical protein